MTIDYAALAERLKAHAECHANVEPHDDEQRQWADDLRTVVTLLRGIADAAPIDRLLKTLRYLIGIAERGEGRKIRDDETIEQFVLGYVKRLEAGEAALRAEVEALRNLLHRAGNELVCDGEVMSESDDEWTRSHACGRCDDYVDRGWPIRTEIRAALAAAKDAEARG